MNVDIVQETSLYVILSRVSLGVVRFAFDTRVDCITVTEGTGCRVSFSNTRERERVHLILSTGEERELLSCH